MSYRDLAIKEALRAGVDPNLFLNMLQAESSWDPNATSPVGAMGLGQIMPETARDPGYGVEPLKGDPYDVAENLRLSADYLAAMKRLFGGDMDMALAAYNQGPGRTQEAGPNPENWTQESQNYVKKIRGTEQAPAASPRPAPRPPGIGEIDTVSMSEDLQRQLLLQQLMGEEEQQETREDRMWRRSVLGHNPRRAVRSMPAFRIGIPR